MHLLIVHYHWRPGGVRQVVESALADLASDPRLGVQEIVLAAGVPPPPSWERAARAAVAGRAVLRWIVDPLLAYVAEWPEGPADRSAELEARAARMVRSLPEPRMVLLENPAVGRHPLIGPAFAAACAAAGTPLVCHHHDFFFDGRWERWPEWTACGTRSLAQALAAAVPAGPGIHHLAVSARDAAWLARLARPETAALCPNPVVRLAPRPEETDRATVWLRRELRTDAPVWLLPCRLLRRKNIVEAVLAARLLAPEAVVATTGAVSSLAEARYAEVVTGAAGAAGAGGWRLLVGILAGPRTAGREPPGMDALMAASAAVVVTSLFEGFGLPVVEAAALGVPCLARRGACPDRAAPAGTAVYDELWVPRELAGGPAERARQETAWARWRSALPPEVAAMVADPPWWQGEGSVAFSRLTLQGQIEVLHACASPEAAAALRPLNPGLAAPARRSAAADPPPATTLASALADVLAASTMRSAGAPVPHRPDATGDGLAGRLLWANHFPLLWPGGDTSWS